MTEEITEAIRNAFNEYLNAVDKIILENQALQIELKRLEQENKELKENQCHFSTCEHIDAEIARYEKLSESFLNYRSALEEIRKAIKSYDLAVDNGVSVDTLYTIGKIINEVLQCE